MIVDRTIRILKNSENGSNAIVPMNNPLIELPPNNRIVMNVSSRPPIAQKETL